MERNKKTPLHFLFLLPLLHICVLGKVSCLSHPDKNLSCYSDYNQTITCAWHSPYQHDPLCTVHARKELKPSRRGIIYNSSCNLKPVDVSRPACKKCSVVFNKGEEMFYPNNEFTVKVTCDHVEKTPVTSIFFRLSSHIKLDPPQKPKITPITNATRVTLRLVKERQKIRNYIFELQWKQEDESWEVSGQKRQNVEKQCDWNCTTTLFSQKFIQGEKYEARVRVQAQSEELSSVWSEWSPSVSWVSHIGEIKPPSGGSGVISAVALCCVVLVLLLTLITLKHNQTVWVFLVTKIKSQPIPDPGLSSLKDVNFQNYLSPQFRSFFKPLDISSLEIATSVDDISPIKPEAEPPVKTRSESSYESTSSSFSNPSYAHVCSAPPPPVSLLTSTGNLDPCAPDTPYGPVCCQSEDRDAGQKREDEKEKEEKIRELFSKDRNNGEPVLVISDYEKVEKLQMERCRLQSSDSGVGSGEEVSQESLEADSINTESHEENQEEREWEKGKEGVFQKLFGGSVDIFGRGSIQVCSGYEPVQKLQPDSPELQSLNVSNEIQEQFGHQESLEDTNESTESTNLLAPPCSFSPAMSSDVTGPALKPALTCNILTLLSSSRSLEVSGDGYMPVTQEQS